MLSLGAKCPGAQVIRPPIMTTGLFTWSNVFVGIGGRLVP